MSSAPTILVPETADEVAALLREAREQRTALVPRGGGTHLASMPRARGECTTLDLRALRRIIAHDPGDLTLCVEAGATLAELDAVLEPHGHELALDAEEPARATIGGLLAADFPTRAGAMGRELKDQVLGTRVAQLDGTLTRSGGRVVKNVTGYDLDKLFVGSRGTLAVLVEVALRVHPRPASRVAVAAACASFAAAHELALRWRDPRPAALDVLDAASASQALGPLPRDLTSATYVVLASWRGSAAVTSAHSERALGAARALGISAEVLEGRLAASAQSFDAAPRRALGCGPGSLVLALCGLPSRAVATHDALVRALERTHLRTAARLTSEAAGLRIRAAFAAAPTRERFAAMSSELAPAAPAGSFHVELEAAPPELHDELWRHRALLARGGGLAVMRRIKAAYDADGLLHPGAWPLLDPELAPEVSR